ncbi:MAG TPA: hypothetical protein DCQ64_23040 [Candidatus Rokubacteria bacterium]|nr:hypothetical protein [Candidatus Rokubacteria bacterium]
MLTALLLVLAQTTTATPAPTRTPAAVITNPLAGTVKPDTTPRALGLSSPASSPLGAVGARVKLDQGKAKTIFTQEVVPTPAKADPARAAAVKKSMTEQLETAMTDENESEMGWREREADRRARLADARASQREVCSRYAVAANSAGMQDGRVSDAAAVILGALLADCTTATRKADVIEAERALVAEDCRKTPGCKPGWLR